MKVLLTEIATEKQAKWLAGLYDRAGYLPPTTIEDSAFGRATIKSLVHPDGTENQPRDPWSLSMVRVFEAPQRKPRFKDRRTCDEVIAAMQGSVAAGDGVPNLPDYFFKSWTIAEKNRYERARTAALKQRQAELTGE